ncbi:phosphoribosylanthranilate isomerase [Kamptonema sp. UHCC 0994]|uniref:phosphoribosylanthranilate isomerase n=1 Tax=Kamptonema sp. UHCC 0994 TaxID=3031329 RepID=UPI0023BA4E38|nr:phosphoribosylanthranilate isomerase [Kamptonema sp. UHCC 0994]MDF0556524.1 phosphoribosylanthranilate isomerase [Kamptonema sp. UHCC 0994]
MRVKICGITKPEQGQAIAQLGAAALGFICVPASPRYIKPELIRAIVAGLPQNVDRIGVFANSTIEVICQVSGQSQLNGVQLHGDESPEFCDLLRQYLPGVEIIKALRVKTPETLEKAAIYAAHVDTLLLDAYHPNQLGGTGKTIDWRSLKQFQPSCPWLLAGGLTPDNILDALKHLQPNGIDLSSGLEIAPGDKDLSKVARLFEVIAVRNGEFQIGYRPPVLHTLSSNL